MLVRYRLDPDNPPTLDAESRARLEAMTEEEIVAAALSDPDAQPLNDVQLARMRRVPLARHVRLKLGISQADFAARFHLPLGTIRDWEQGRAEPDAAAKVLLQVIARDPEAVARALEAA
jgi:putative transcriptional regulator